MESNFLAQLFYFAQIFHREIGSLSLKRTNCQNFELTLLTFWTQQQNGLFHVTDMAVTARNVTTTAAGNNSGSNFTSACRCMCQPSSDLKLTNIASKDNCYIHLWNYYIGIY